MNFIAPMRQTATVAALLLNAWTAEYAMRFRLLESAEQTQPVAWTCPQAYFALLFSVRAVLAVDGIQMANPHTIEKQVERWVSSGRYGRGFSTTNNPLAELLNFRPNAEAMPLLLHPMQIAHLQDKLIQKINAVSVIHETYILTRLGDEVYEAIINDLPNYLKNGFVGERTMVLLEDN